MAFSIVRLLLIEYNPIHIKLAASQLSEAEMVAFNVVFAGYPQEEISRTNRVEVGANYVKAVLVEREL